ncbi:hypothetical protein J4448_06810 [Candidatus Woesearchaeota archaeon]|nr:hypothetical protein [Candidatus Woesearchaeota archaeon]
MQKRGQISSEILVYALTVVILGVILVMGYKYFSSSKNLMDKGELVQLQSRLAADAATIGKDHGRYKKISYPVPQNLDEVCIADLNQKDKILSSKLISFYPLIQDSLNSGANKNVFFIGATEQNSYYTQGIQINHYPHINCFKSKNNKVELGLEGLGGGTSLILTDFVTTAKISSNANTILQSADEILTLQVPKGVQTNAASISIEVIEPPTEELKNGISEVYKFGPVGVTFNPPIELSIKYNPAIVGDCPSELSFYQYDENGILKAIVPSKKIDCESKIAFFDISEF